MSASIRLTPMADGRACSHGTAVAIGGDAILLLGPSGVGKSSVAAQMLLAGAGLVSDDLVVLQCDARGVTVEAPHAGPAGLELRGFGIVSVVSAGPARLRAMLSLGSPAGRFPEATSLRVLGWEIPIRHHPTSSDVAAKAILWLRSLG